MHIPLQIDLGEMPPSAAVMDAIRVGAAHLNRYFPALIGCQVALASAAAPPSEALQIRIRIIVPSAALDVEHAAGCGTAPDAAVRSAFEAALCRLQAWVTATCADSPPPAPVDADQGRGPEM